MDPLPSPTHLPRLIAMAVCRAWTGPAGGLPVDTWRRAAGLQSSSRRRRWSPSRLSARSGEPALSLSSDAAGAVSPAAASAAPIPRCRRRPSAPRRADHGGGQGGGRDGAWASALRTAAGARRPVGPATPRARSRWIETANCCWACRCAPARSTRGWVWQTPASTDGAGPGAGGPIGAGRADRGARRRPPAGTGPAPQRTPTARPVCAAASAHGAGVTGTGPVAQAPGPAHRRRADPASG